MTIDHSLATKCPICDQSDSAHAFPIEAHSDEWILRVICYSCGAVCDIITCPVCKGECTGGKATGTGGCDKCGGDGIIARRLN